MGRHPKPTYLKELEGNPGKRKLNDKEPQYGTDSISPPDWLCPIALKEWQRLSPQLQRLKLLTDAELALYSLYCQSYADVGRLTKEIRKEGEVMDDQNGQPRKNPKIMIRSTMTQVLTDCLKQLGFSPVTRAKIMTEATEGKDANPFLKFSG